MEKKIVEPMLNQASFAESSEVIRLTASKEIRLFYLKPDICFLAGRKNGFWRCVEVYQQISHQKSFGEKERENKYEFKPSLEFGPLGHGS